MICPRVLAALEPWAEISERLRRWSIHPISMAVGSQVWSSIKVQHYRSGTDPISLTTTYLSTCGSVIVCTVPLGHFISTVRTADAEPSPTRIRGSFDDK